MLLTSAAFMEFLTATSAYDLLIQTPHSSVITLTGDDRAGATTTVHELTRGVGLADTEFGAGGAEVNVEQYGIYHDRFARIDGEWKFTRRIFEPVYADLHAVTGDVLTQRSAMVRPE